MYPTLSYRLTWGGPLGSMGETWSCGLRLWNIGMTLDSGDQSWQAHWDSCYAALPAMEALLVAFHHDASKGMSPDAVLEVIKLNPVGTDGRQNELLNTAESHVLTGGAGGGTIGPHELAAAVTLRTDLTRGRGHAGRVFLPIGNPGFTTNGQFTGTTLGNLAHGMGALIWAINAVDDWLISGTNTHPLVHVLSNRSGRGDTTGVGPAYPVTSVAVGSVPDVQRRRRRSDVEAYTGGSITESGS